MKKVHNAEKSMQPVLWAKILIYIAVIFCALICLLPLVNILAISLSSKETADLTFLWPKVWSLQSYE